jgi:hypothetical protein
VARQSLALAGHVTESGVRRRADDPSRHLEEPAQQEAGKFRGQVVLSLQTVAEKVQAFSLVSRLVLLHMYFWSWSKTDSCSGMSKWTISQV